MIFLEKKILSKLISAQEFVFKRLIFIDFELRYFENGLILNPLIFIKYVKNKPIIMLRADQSLESSIHYVSRDEFCSIQGKCDFRLSIFDIAGSCLAVGSH